MWLGLEDSEVGVYQAGLHKEPYFQTPLGASDSTELFSWFQMSLRRGNQLIAAVCDGLITALGLSNPPCKSEGGESPGPRSTHE